MSLTSILKSSHPKCKEIKEIIKSIAPKKSDFKTYSGIPSFSNYQPISTIQLLNSYDYSVVGTAFDFLARIICAYHTNTVLRAKDFEIPRINIFLAEPKNKSLLNLYKKIQNQIDFFFSNKEKTFEIDDSFISGIILVAKLDHLLRSGFLFTAKKNDLVKPMDKTVYDDINCLINGFNHYFIKTNLIQADSLITYNPRFSANISIALGGIDADICIDNTLYDFKSTKNHGFMIKDSLQITSYYIFYLMDKIMRSTVNMQRHQIERIALYKARFGQTEYFDVNNISKDDMKLVILELNKVLKLGMPDQRIKDFQLVTYS